MKATELEYLKWWFCNADFGPGECDVRYFLNRQFVADTGKELPPGYGEEDE